MADQINTGLLQRVHSLFQQQTLLEERIRRAPMPVISAKNAVKKQEAKIAEIKEAIRDAKLNADRKQLQLREREQRVDKLKGQRNECKSNREYQLLNEQIAADEQANQVLQDEILELLERDDTLKDTLSQENDHLEQVRQAVVRAQQEADHAIEQLQKEMSDVRRDVHECLRQLPAELSGNIVRLARTLGDNALARVEDGSCGHCMTVLTTQMRSNLSMKRLTYCPSCGSVLYFVVESISSDAVTG
ncbi:MAG TPA: hypothetical protein PKD64_14595 [Pirellulaceae bacterium]|nr:hypothetical protein [Pirellulaceae bacterium]HMO93411.1 hypothetical protein [Pirellulaceae bacterium]HMP70465.1 hypothetical protein [Pirellulaceae bacterium]